MNDDTPAVATGGQEISPTPEVNENPPPIEPSAYKYEEINGKSAAQIAREEPPAPVEAPTPEPAEEEIPLEEVGKKIAEDAARAVLESQKADVIAAEEARLAEETKEPTEKERVYIDWEKKFNDANGRPPSYLEAMQFVETQAVATIEEKQQAAKAEEIKQADEARRVQEEENQRVNTFVDDELADLYAGNKLTKVIDPNNPSDQGVVERQSLFARWAEVNNERRAKGLPDIISATRIAEFYWKKPSAQPAGVDAPVQGSRSATVDPNAPQEYTNADLKKPWNFWKKV